MNQDALYNTCVNLAKKATKGMQDILKRVLAKPYDSSPYGLYNNLDLSVTPEDGGSKIVIESHFPESAKWVQWGRRPGKRPPWSALYDWCLTHWKDKKVPLKTQAFLVARKIGREGIQPRPFLLPVERMIHLLKPSIVEIKTKDITEKMLQMLNTSGEQKITMNL